MPEVKMQRQQKQCITWHSVCLICCVDEPEWILMMEQTARQRVTRYEWTCETTRTRQPPERHETRRHTVNSMSLHFVSFQATHSLLLRCSEE